MKHIRPTQLAVLLLAQALGASAQQTDVLWPQRPSFYPTRNVRIVEPFGPGGGSALLTSEMARDLTILWVQLALPDAYHPGQGGTAGPAIVATSPADGYTVLLNTSAQAYTAAARDDLSYDPIEDFTPVLPLTIEPYVLVASKSAGVSTVSELVAATKAHPGQLAFGHSGIGSETHLGILEFNRQAGIQAVPTSPRPRDAISNVVAKTIEGKTSFMLAPILLVLPAIRDGRLLALGVTTKRRSPLLPDVPTIAESGVPGFDFPIWHGLWVRAGTPATVVDKLASDVSQVLASREFHEWMASHGCERITMTQQEFMEFVRSETRRAAQILEASDWSSP